MNNLQKSELLSCHFDEQIMYDKNHDLTCQNYQCTVQTLNNSSLICSCGDYKSLLFVWIRELHFDTNKPPKQVLSSSHYCRGSIKHIKIELRGLSKNVNILDACDIVLNMTYDDLCLGWYAFVTVTHTSADICNQILNLMFMYQIVQLFHDLHILKNMGIGIDFINHNDKHNMLMTKILSKAATLSDSHICYKQYAPAFKNDMSTKNLKKVQNIILNMNFTEKMNNPTSLKLICLSTLAQITKLNQHALRTFNLPSHLEQKLALTPIPRTNLVKCPKIDKHMKMANASSFKIYKHDVNIYNPQGFFKNRNGSVIYSNSR